MFLLSKTSFVVALVAIFVCSLRVKAEPWPWGNCVGLDSNNQTVCDNSGILPDIPGYTKPIDATQRGQPRAAWDTNQYFSWIMYWGSSELTPFKCEELCPKRTTYRGFTYKWFGDFASNYCMCHYDVFGLSNVCWLYSQTGFSSSCNSAGKACEGIAYSNAYYKESFYSYDAVSKPFHPASPFVPSDSCATFT